jgi:N4-gp56 family major capsid protein
MATTDFGALQAAQKKVWSLKLFIAGRDQSFFFKNGFVGSGDADTNSVIQKVTELTETERGKECVMQLVLDMTSDGVVGDNELTNNEEALINDSITIRIDQLRNGTKNKGMMAEQATVIRFREQAKNKLGFWMADKMDELMFLTISGRAYTLKTDGSTRTGSQLPSLSFAADVAAPSSGRIMYAGSATSEATLTTSDKMSWATLVRAKQMAIRKKLNPIMSGGKGYYCVVMTPEQERDLVLDPTYQTIVKSAADRGLDHPLLKGALVNVQGLTLYSHNKVFNTLGLSSGSKWGSGSTVDGAQAMLLGAQAAGVAMLGSVFWREAEITDYENRPGVGVGRKLGMLKPQFKSLTDLSSGAPTKQDFGCIAVKTAAAA